jgi:hypothetical protein
MLSIVNGLKHRTRNQIPHPTWGVRGKCRPPHGCLGKTNILLGLHEITLPCNGPPSAEHHDHGHGDACVHSGTNSAGAPRHRVDWSGVARLIAHLDTSQLKELLCALDHEGTTLTRPQHSQQRETRCVASATSRHSRPRNTRGSVTLAVAHDVIAAARHSRHRDTR